MLTDYEHERSKLLSLLYMNVLNDDEGGNK